MSDTIFLDLLVFLELPGVFPFVLTVLTVLPKWPENPILAENHRFWVELLEKVLQTPIQARGPSQKCQNCSEPRAWIGVFTRKTRKIPLFGDFRGF